jgi:hypothetical protein
MSEVATDERKRSLWERILELLEEDLVERRDRKVFVEVQGEAGLLHKEIGEPSAVVEPTLSAVAPHASGAARRTADAGWRG